MPADRGATVEGHRDTVATRGGAAGTRRDREQSARRGQHEIPLDRPRALLRSPSLLLPHGGVRASGTVGP
jgi:hypothetical protein